MATQFTSWHLQATDDIIIHNLATDELVLQTDEDIYPISAEDANLIIFLDSLWEAL